MQEHVKCDNERKSYAAVEMVANKPFAQMRSSVTDMAGLPSEPSIFGDLLHASLKIASRHCLGTTQGSSIHASKITWATGHFHCCTRPCIMNFLKCILFKTLSTSSILSIMVKCVCVCVIPTSEGRPHGLIDYGETVFPHSTLRSCSVKYIVLLKRLKSRKTCK